MGLTRITSDGITDGTITGSDLATNVDLADNQKIRFGASDDLEIYHDGTNNVFDHIAGSSTRFMHGNEKMLVMTPDSHVELYFDNSLKFQTHSAGVLVSGNVYLNDNNKFIAGTSNDLQIYHDGSHSYIQDSGTGDLTLIASKTVIGSSNNAEVCASFTENGAVELFHNNSSKLQTTALGVDITGNCTITGNFRGNDNVKLNLGNSDDLQIFHDGGDSFIKDTGTGGIRIDTSQFIVRNAAGSSPNMEIKDDGRTFIPSAYNETTSGSVNLRVLSDGQLKRSTSSIKYKKDITDATWGLTEVLKLKPKTFKNNATGEDADDKIYGGFTAEDIHDLGLTEFVDYNEKNEPDALAYGNMVALMAKAIQDLNGKVGILETEVAALKAS